MPNVINATSTGNGGLITQGDDSGILNIQTNETTAISIDASQNATFAGKVTSASALTLASNGTTTAVTIDTSQNVGIGTTSPSAKLHVSGGQSYVTGASSAGAYSRWYNNAQTTGDFQVGQGWLSVSDNIGVLCNNANAAMILATNGAERMRITSSGNFGIGTTTGLNSKVTLYSDCNSLTAMEIRDTGTTGGYLIAFYNSSSNLAGGIIHNGTTTVNYSTSSDYRMKENIAPMTGALSKVALLNPVTYKWKEEFGGESGQGFIAHELQAVIPDAVTGKKDAVDADGNPKYQGIDTSYLVATLTAAIQELKAINDTQAETITALTARVVALESRGTV